MGCCQSTEDIEGRQRNDEIDYQLKKDRINMKSEIKMLLLGEDSNILCVYALLFGRLTCLFFFLESQALVNPENQLYLSK